MLLGGGVRDVVLVDLSPVGVDRARQAGFDARVGDLLTGLPFDNDSFATACALDVMEHLLDPLSALRELARIAPEVVIAVPNFNSLRARVDVARGIVPFQNRPARGHSYWFNERVLRELITDAGLQMVEWRVQPSVRLGAPGRALAIRWSSVFGVAFAARLERR
jgi:SAM-dependent methyltransferase